MRAKYYDSNNNITILVSKDNYFYAYCEDERWNGQYYKGWRADNHGNELKSWGVYNIRPLGTESFGTANYEIWQD